MDNAFFCKVCEQKNTCKQVCKEVEQWLRKQGIKSAKWIRPRMSSYIKGGNQPREINFSSLDKKGWDKVRETINPEGLGYKENN